MAVVTPWAQINGSLPPLIPKPEDVLPPPTLGAVPDGSGSTLAKIPQTKSGVQVFHQPTGKEQYEQRLDSKLGQDVQKDLNPFGSANNHPGVFGKILHGLSVATGGPNRRAMEEAGIDNRLNAIGKLESEENLQGAQAGNQTAEAGNKREATAEMPGKTASEESLQGAQTENQESEAKDRDLNASYGPPLATAYAHRVSEVLKSGGDPAQDPIAQHLADAITSIQKQPADSTGPKTIQKEVGGKPHEFAWDSKTGSYDLDQGAAFVKPTEASQGEKNLWAVKQPDGTTKVVSLRAGDTVPDGAVSLSGQSQLNTKDLGNQQGASHALDYANSYLASGQFTGPGDEALQDQYFEMAKPSTGFRMNQAQIDQLHAMQSWVNSAEGFAYHAKTGTWFSPQQRQQIVETMNALGKAKGVKTAEAGGPQTIGTTTQPDGTYERDGKRFVVKGGQVYAQ